MFKCPACGVGGLVHETLRNHDCPMAAMVPISSTPHPMACGGCNKLLGIEYNFICPTCNPTIAPFMKLNTEGAKAAFSMVMEAFSPSGAAEQLKQALLSEVEKRKKKS